MTTHTQGPWTSVYANDTGPDDDYFVEFYEINTLDGTEIAKAGTEANARLIAAAPDLLEALQECLPHLERDDQHIDALGWLKPHYTKACAAIHKATGENQ